MLLVVLGSPNLANGKLLPFALSRCDKAFSLYQQCKDDFCKVLCTGGFGEEFNVTKTPHAQYTKQYLMSLGIPESNFLPHVESRFTLEDASLAKETFDKYCDEEIVIVSSDFHMRRVRYIFTTLYPKLNFKFEGSLTELPTVEKNRLEIHERLALLREQNALSSDIEGG